MSDPNTKQNHWNPIQLLMNSSRFGRALLVLTICGFGGFIFIYLYASQMSSVSSVFGTGALVGGASFFLGGLLGFLFGIPKTVKLQDQSEGANKGPKERYTGNTNLEDISDWLTKIIIGVGLVELSKIPPLLNQFAQMIAPALGGSRSEGFAIAIFTYYSVIGFLFVYLATRAYMESGLELLKQKEINKLNAQELRKRNEIDELNAEMDKYREALNKNGLALYNQGNYVDAIQAYEMAIKIDPKFAETWHNKGLTLNKLGRTDEANAAFDKAKELGYADKS